MSRKIKRVLKFTPNFKRTRLFQVLCSVLVFFKLCLKKQYYVVGNEHRDLRVSLLSHVWLLPARLLCPWDSWGKNTGVGCHFLLQGIFPTQRLNPHLPHWQAGSLPLVPLGSPRRRASLSGNWITQAVVNAPNPNHWSTREHLIV